MLELSTIQQIVSLAKVNSDYKVKGKKNSIISVKSVFVCFV